MLLRCPGAIGLHGGAVLPEASFNIFLKKHLAEILSLQKKVMLTTLKH